MQWSKGIGFESVPGEGAVVQGGKYGISFLEDWKDVTTLRGLDISCLMEGEEQTSESMFTVSGNTSTWLITYMQ